MIQGTNRRSNFSMAIEFLHCLEVFQWIKWKQMAFTFEKIGASKSYLLNFSPGSFEEIFLNQSCRELNDISFEIRLN